MTQVVLADKEVHISNYVCVAHFVLITHFMRAHVPRELAHVIEQRLELT